MGHSPDTQQQQTQQYEQCCPADEAELFAEHREDEVGLFLGNQRVVVLGSLEQAGSGQPTVADRDLGLEHREALLTLRVDERGEAVELGLAQEPATNHRHDRYPNKRQGRHDVGERSASHDHDPSSDRGEHHYGPEVGLEQDKTGDQTRNGQTGNYVDERQTVSLLDGTEPGRQGDDQCELGELRRLQRDEPKGVPRHRAVELGAEKEQADEQQDGAAVDERDSGFGLAVVNRCDDGGEEAAHSDEQHLST